MENDNTDNRKLNNQKDIEINQKDEEENNLLNKSLQNLSGNIKLVNTREEEAHKNEESKGMYPLDCSSSEFCLHFLLLGIIGVFLLIIFFFVEKTYDRVIVLKQDFQIKKPLSDKAVYRILKLENKMEVLLISDSETSKCAASLNIGVGSFSDEITTQGLAHLTEHLIFLGSREYPDPAAFESHLQSHAGMSNAFTDKENTAYYFDVNPLGFEKALSIFSSMLAHPLFDEQHMDKEINAVSSENDKNFNNDSWRQNQLLCSLGNPKSPFALFSTGNNQSLRQLDMQVLNQKVKDYYFKYYIPSNMRLVLLSNQNIGSLENFAARFFADIRQDTIINEEKLVDEVKKLKNEEVREKPSGRGASSRVTLPQSYQNKNKRKDEINSLIYEERLNFNKPDYTNLKAFSEEYLGKFVWWQKSSTGQVIDIMFYYPGGVDKYYRTKPLTYLSYLISYSGEGSLISSLIKKKLATKLDSGYVFARKDFSMFAISITLTKKGLENSSDVISLTFKYLKLVRDTPIDLRIFEEIKKMETTKFNFLDKNNDYGTYLSGLAKNLFLYDLEDVLFSDYNYDDFNKTLIEEFRDKLIPENSLILLGSDSYPINLKFDDKNSTELWYNTTFNSRKLQEVELLALKKGQFADLSTPKMTTISEEKLMEVTKEEFNLRPPNEFVSQENSLISCVKNVYNQKEHEFCKKEKNDLTPSLKLNTTQLNLWFKLDRSFSLPKINSFWQIIPNTQNITETLVMLMWGNYLDYYVSNFLSQATEAGNGISVEFNENGLYIKIVAYSDINNKITSRVLEALYSKNFTQSQYNEIFEITSDKLNELISEAPYKKSQKIFKKLIKPDYYLSSELLSEMSKINYFKFTQILNSLLERLQFNSLLHGYITEEALYQFTDIMNKHILKPTEISNEVVDSKEIKSKQENKDDVNKNDKNQNNIVIQTPISSKVSTHREIDGSYAFIQVNDLISELNHEISNYYQVSTRDYKLSLLLTMIKLDIANIFYDVLRTQKQLGYVTFCDKVMVDNYHYFVCLVQGRAKLPEEVNIEIDKVIQMAKDTKIALLDATLFKSLKRNVEEVLKKDYDNLKEKTDEIFKEIELKSYDFKRKDNLLAVLQEITIPEVQELYNQVFFNDPKKISIRLYSGKSTLPVETTEEYSLNKNVTTIISNKLDMFNKNQIMVQRKNIKEKNN